MDKSQLPISLHERLAFHSMTKPLDDVYSTFNSLQLRGLDFFARFVECTGLDKAKADRVLNFARKAPNLTSVILSKILTFYNEIFEANDAYMTFGKVKEETGIKIAQNCGINSIKKDLARACLLAPADVFVVWVEKINDPKIMHVQLNAIEQIEHHDGVISLIEFSHGGKSYKIDKENYYFDGLETPHVKSFGGVCPAVFASSFLSENAPTSNIDALIGLLDWVLFRYIGKEYSQTMTLYPPVVFLENKCQNFKDIGEQRFYCEDGKIGGETCGKCSKEKFGPGAMYGIGASSTEDIQALFNNDLVKYIAPPVDANEFINKSLMELVDFVMNMAIGRDSDPSDSAKNEAQVELSFESKENTLALVASNVEKTLTSLLTFCLGVAEGAERAKGAQVFLGREYYLVNSETLLEHYKDIVDFAPQFVIEEAQNRLIQTLGKNKPKVQKRLAVLSLIEPYSTLSWAVLKDLPTNERDLFVKMNFTNLVADFEAQKGEKIENMQEIEKTVKDFNLFADQIFKQNKKSNGNTNGKENNGEAA